MSQVRGIADFHRTTAHRRRGAERQQVSLGRQGEPRMAVAPDHFGGRSDTLALRTRRHRSPFGTDAQPGEFRYQRCSRRRDFEGLQFLRIPVFDHFRITVQTQGIVTAVRSADFTAGTLCELIAERSPGIRKQIERHRCRRSCRGLRPIENNLQGLRMRVVVAQLLVLARCRRKHRKQIDERFFHRLPPFFSLLFPRPSSHISEISAFVGPNQCRCRVSFQT